MPRVQFSAEVVIYFFAITYRSALGPHSFLFYEHGGFPQGVKRSRCETDNSCLLVSKLGTHGVLSPFPPTRIYGLVPTQKHNFFVKTEKGAGTVSYGGQHFVLLPHRFAPVSPPPKLNKKEK